MTVIQAITFLVFGMVALVTNQHEVSYILFGCSIICGIVNDIVSTIRIIHKKGANNDSEAM